MNYGWSRTFLLTVLRRLSLVSSIPFVMWSLVATTTYAALGPWFVGELISGHYGVCFMWGVWVNGHLLQYDVQYTTGCMHVSDMFLCIFVCALEFHFVSIFRI